MSDTPALIDQIKSAPTDLHLVGLLMQVFDLHDMPLLVAALTRAQELVLLQRGLK